MKSSNANARRYQSKMPITDKNIGKNYLRGTYQHDLQLSSAARNLVKLVAGKISFTPVKVTPRPNDAYQGWPFSNPPRGMRLRHRMGQRPHWAKRNAAKDANAQV